MKMNPLGRTGITVPELCLGTMTYGVQTPETDAHAQMDMVMDAGVNFIDTAEMYPVNPISAETQGDSERIIGTWLEKRGKRDDVIIATKHAGNGWAHIRDRAGISGASIPEVLDGNLKRLKTDYIDLYQFHWPNRGSYMFRQNWTFDPSSQDRNDTMQHMEDCLGALQNAVDAGKIRAFGLSNESAWGTAQWLRLSDAGLGPRVASIQNEYSLLCRLYDTDLAELSVNEDVGLLAFSPLATGLLTGKYQQGEIPDASRMSINGDLGGRKTPRVFPAVDAYLALAQKYGVDPVHMALAWCRTRPFMASAIFGATRVDQLEHALASTSVTLSDELIAEIDETHRQHPMVY
jgi:aryl-alcohol dehydrogenase-like predicted oxidoreductase